MIAVTWRIEIPSLGWVRFDGTYNEVFTEASKLAANYNETANVVSTEYYASPQNFSVAPGYHPDFRIVATGEAATQ